MAGLRATTVEYFPDGFGVNSTAHAGEASTLTRNPKSEKSWLAMARFNGNLLESPACAATEQSVTKQPIKTAVKKGCRPHHLPAPVFTLSRFIGLKLINEFSKGFAADPIRGQFNVFLGIALRQNQFIVVDTYYVAVEWPI